MNVKPITGTGFTLVELMVVVTIIGILTAIGLPSFSEAIRNSRLTTSANQLVTSLNVARSEAVKRGQNVVVIKTGTNWEDGWKVFVDIDRSPASHINAFNDDGDPTTPCEAAEDCVLRVYEALPGNFTLRATNDFASYIFYKPSGESNNSGLFAVCDNSDGNNTPERGTSRLIIVSPTGRVRQGQDSDGDGIPNKDSGNLSSCTNP